MTPSETMYNRFVVFFIFTIPYGYISLNLIHSNTNPLSLYLLPILFLLMAPKISKIYDIEMVLMAILAVLAMSTFHSLFQPFTGGQALVRLISYIIGFSYFFIIAREFCSDINIEHWITVAHYPLLLLGIFQVISLNTGLFTDLNTTLRLALVSVPSIVPSRVSLLASEPSFIAFQIPLLLYLFHKLRKPLPLIAIFLISIFTKSINVYLTVGIFYVALIAFRVKEHKISRRQFGVFLSAAGLFITYILSTPGVYNRLTSITQDGSVLERFYYIFSKFPMLWEHPFGVGVGQYGVYVYNIFNEYNIPIVNPWILTDLRSGTLDPWSFVLGLVVEGGIFIVPFVTLFIYKLFRVSAQSSISFAAFMSSSFLLFQVYPPATPYIWIVLGLIWKSNI